MTFLLKTVTKYLRDTADKIEQGKCDLTEEQAMEIMSVIANEELSKDQACGYLNMSRSKFDSLVRGGRLPRGRKLRGRKELTWRKKDLFKVQVLN